MFDNRLGSTTRTTYVVKAYDDSNISSRIVAFSGNAERAKRELETLPIGSFIQMAVGSHESGYRVYNAYNKTVDGIEVSNAPWSFDTDTLANI